MSGFGFEPGPYSQNDQEEGDLPSGWSEQKDDKGNTYYYPSDDQTKVTWDRPTQPPQANVVPSPQPSDPSNPSTQSDIVNRKFTDIELDIINRLSVDDPSRYVAIANNYDEAFEGLKEQMQTSKPQTFDLSIYTGRLTKIHKDLMSRLAVIKQKLVRFSEIESLSISLLDKLYAANELFKSVMTKLEDVNNDPTDYNALGAKIKELEDLIAEIEKYPGMESQAPVGGRKKRKTISRGKRNGKGKKTKRVRRTQTRKRNGGKCKCSLWGK
jgi:hypothetical protein